VSENLVVRLETEGDQAAIREIHRVAFADHPYSKQTEHLIVDRAARRGGAAAVACRRRRCVVVGHVAFSPVAIGEVDSNCTSSDRSRHTGAPAPWHRQRTRIGWPVGTE
jgi:predicted N-acetyltransferase YhbS